MRIGRTVPPAAAPLGWRNVRDGLAGALHARESLRAREDEIRRAFGVEHVFLLSSGSAALTITLQALRALSARTEVILPAYTCFSVPAAVLKAGLRPVLCDIDPRTFDYDHALLQRTLTAETLCVVAHHLFGVPSDVDRTRTLCRAHRIFVLEDAAQAMGVEADGRKLGTLGDAGVFSFGRGKHLTCGAGGAVVTNSPQIARAVGDRVAQLPASTPGEMIRDLLRVVTMTVFIRPHLYWIPAAIPFLRLGETIFPDDVPVRRMTGMHAGLLRGWQHRLTEANRVRSATASYFGEWLPMPVDRRHPYLRLPVLASSAAEKRRLCSVSRSRGLGLSAGYPTPISDIPQLRAAAGGRQFPSARRVAQKLVTVPTHHLVSESDRRAIAALWRDARSA